jgi:hypothetical protein
MPTFAEIHKRLRQRLQAEGGRWTEAALERRCQAIAFVATEEMPRWLEEPPLAARPSLTPEGDGVSSLQVLHDHLRVAYADEIVLIRRECARLLAAARRRGLRRSEAETAVWQALARAFRVLVLPPPAPGTRLSGADIRVRVRQKLRATDPCCSAEDLRVMCKGLAAFALDPSGLALRLGGTAPYLWSDAAEQALDLMRRRFAEELEGLRAETSRWLEAARARGLSERAVCRQVRRRLYREFVRGHG